MRRRFARAVLFIGLLLLMLWLLAALGASVWMLFVMSSYPNFWIVAAATLVVIFGLAGAILKIVQWAEVL